VLVQTATDVTAPRIAREERGQRPGRVLTVWASVLIVLAALAPIVQEGLGVPFELLSLVMLAPALAGVVVLVRPGWMPPWWPPASAFRVGLVTAGALVAVMAFTATLALLTGRVPSWTTPGFGSPLWLFFILQTLGVLSEEIGWRGVAQRAGERFARPVVVSATAGFLFGATHLGYWGLGPVPVLVFASTAALMSLTITTLFQGSLWQRMVPATVVHLGVNLAVASLARSDEPLPTMLPALVAAAVMLVVAAVAKALIDRPHRSGARPAV
jgi:membrane protease YdiL (CAAX protease family)